MTYHEDSEVRIRDLMPGDAQIITDEETAQGWHVTVDKYLARLKDQQEGKCVSMVAEYHGQIAGYINVYPAPEAGAFGHMGIPEIVDFGVLEKYRKRGIGTLLMDAAEKVAGTYASRVCLGVGLHAGYGSAQRMYARRGYIPDGSGVWYGNRVCEPYSECCNDDDLILYMSRDLP